MPPPLDARRALAAAGAARGELLALLARLIARPSPAGASAEAAQLLLATWLTRRGFAVECVGDDPAALRDHPDYSPPPPSTARPVNLAAHPTAKPPSPTILFAHVDTEPPAPGWTTPPDRAVRRGPRVHGLGAADDKGGLAAAAMAAVLAARHFGRAPVLLSVHGKGGGARGTLPAFHRLATRPAAALYVHPPETGEGLGVLKNESRGIVDIGLRVRGWRAPPREINTPESSPREESGDALKACLDLIAAVHRGPLAAAEVHLGRLEAGEGPGLVPLRAAAELRVLFRGEQTVSGVLAAFREAAAAHQSAAGAFRFEVRASGLRANPARTGWNHPLTRRLRRSVHAVTGHAPREYTHHLASDIRFPIRLAGIPAIGIGARAGNFYAPQEWVDPDDLVRLVAILLHTAAPPAR